MKIQISIDPGISGAVAVRDADGRVYVDAMPETLRDIWDHLTSLDAGQAVVEDAGYHMRGNNASSSAKFARHCGAVEMALTAAGIPWQSVRPQKWQAHFGTMPKDKAERKRRIKELMQRRYPDIAVTLSNADALAILTWMVER